MVPRARWKWPLILAAILAIGAGAAVLADQSGSIDIPILDLAPNDSANPEEPTEAELTAMSKLPSEPAPPSGILASDGTPAEDDDEYQAYVAETAQAVVDGAEEIESLGMGVLNAYMDDDTEALVALLAEDERVSTSEAQALLDRYPELLDGDPAANVNVYALENATLYMYSLNVIWTDAGIASTHVLDVPMRLVGGKWYLTTLDLRYLDSRYIQSVMLR